jgi:hypothetical protein
MPILKFEPELKDYLAVGLWGDPNVDLTGEIEEDKVTRFCTGCDHFQETCILFTRNDQLRYAARGNCGGARVNGIRGDMTSEGFKAFETK